jgi:hypothetical protein
MAIITISIILSLTDLLAGTETLYWLKDLFTMAIVD